jgi:Fur family ferric uptake transcriptional regulator
MLLLECFNESKGKHMTVDELYAIAKSKYAEIGIATVYRNVKYLLEQNLIKKVDLPNSLPYYEISVSNEEHSHHHLICRECHKIVDFEDDLLESVENIIEKAKNFKITDHRVVFYGICSNCKPKKESKK